MNITYYIHDLNFPLREGIRKQAWWIAKEMQKKGHHVNILSTSKNNKTIENEGIKIKYGSAWKIRNTRTDIIHYINHPSPLILPLMLFGKAKRQYMTMYEGHLNRFWKRIWYPLTKFITKKRIKKITIQTEFQTKLMNKADLRIPIKIIPPLITNFKRTNKRSEKPSLLFMTHMLEAKGIYDVLDSFIIARKKIPNLTLIIADSGMTKNNLVYQKIKKINKGDIILKKIVNPQEEMSKCWVYLYPIQTAKETFSVPLSLIESMQVGTPYICTKVGGLSEYFNEETLVPPKNPLLLSKKIEQLIKNPKVYPLKKNIKNSEVIAQFEKLYYS